MKVFFDTTCLGTKQLTGIGVYAKYLLQELQLISSEVKPVIKLSRWKKRKIVESHINENPSLYLPYLPFSLPLQKTKNIFHGPDFFLPQRPDFKKVVTILDVVVFEESLTSLEFATAGQVKFKKMLSVCKPDKIITISNFSKNRILHFFPELKDKVQVIYLGLDHINNPSTIQEAREKTIKLNFGKFILCLGTIEKRKNTAGVVRAFEILKKEDPALKLVLAGKNGFGSDETHKCIENSNFKKDIHVLDYVDDKTKESLLHEAQVVLFPSVYEGFGLPALEALRIGCPTVTCKSTVFEELISDPRFLADDFSPQAIAEKTKELLRFTADDRLELKNQNLFSNLTWKKTAQETWALYQGI